MTQLRPTAALALAAAACAGPPAAPPPTAAPPAPAAAAVTGRPSSSAFLALLPAGEEKRRFILDCTGCHTFDARTAFPGGAPRPREDWAAAVERMLGYAGAHTPFPVIAAGRDPEATAEWLARHLTAPPAHAPGSAPAARAAAGTVTEFAYPYPQDLPHDVRVDGEGKVVITGMMTHRVLVLDPSTGEYREEPIPVQRANPRALDIGPGGDWWVLLGAPQRIARRSAETGAWETFEIGMYPHSIERGVDGRIWFNGHFTRDPELIGYLDPSTGAVRTFEVPSTPALKAGAGPIPYDLRIAPDGAVWGTELHGNRIFRFDPASETFRTWTMPVPHSGPRRVDFDARGTLWIPEYANNRLTSFDPAAERFRSWELPLPDALPYVVRVDRARNRVWIGTGAADGVLEFDPAGERFTVHPLPSVGALVRHVDVDRRTGELWGAYGASPGIPPKIVRVRPAGG